MSRYFVAQRRDCDELIFSLHDVEHGLVAEVIPGIGAQCHRFEWTVRGKQIALLDAADSIEALRNNPSAYGIPLLFPFPNRVEGGTFTFAGQAIRLPVNEPERNNALHGFVYDKPWTVRSSGANEDKAWVTCSFTSADDSTMNNFFPFQFLLEYTVCLRAGRLETRFRVQNVGDGPMPMGFGVHPWFPLPLTDEGTRAHCRITAPVTHVWELDNLLPTGRLLRPSPERDLQRGIALGDLEFDDVYTGIKSENTWEATYSDPEAGIEIAVISDDVMREFVVYAPHERSVICLEPYSCTTNAFNLHSRDVPAGLIILEPHETWTTHIQYVPRLLD